MEATNPTPQAERPAIADSAQGEEIAQVEAVDSVDAVKGEITEPTFDLEKVPREQREIYKKAYNEVNRTLQSGFTKKTQELSAREKQRELEINSLKTQLDQYQQILSDPQKYAALRQPQPEPKLETVNDLMNYIDQKLKSVQENGDKTVESKILQIQDHKEWESAYNALYKKDPELADVVVEYTKGKKDVYSNLLKSGYSKDQVLLKAYDDLVLKIRPKLEQTEKQAREAVLKKKQATTAVPRKTVTTEGDQRGLSYEERRSLTIEKVRSKIGS